jgi:uncharacterized protein (TIGR02145 family)
MLDRGKLAIQDMKRPIFSAIIAIALLAQASTAQNSTCTAPVDSPAATKTKKNPTLRDSRDGHVYKIAKLGKQTWMVENLNADIPGSYCYDNINKNCKTHGRLYTWKAAMRACPKGWRLPDKEEFASLVDYLTQNSAKNFNPTLGGQRVCFNGKDVWNDYCESATSIGVPGGTKINFAYEGLNEKSYFWTSSEEMAYIAHFWEYDGETGRFSDGDFEENFAYSVRCVKK